MYSILSALVLRQLPYPDAGRLVIPVERLARLDIAEDWFSTPQYFRHPKRPPQLRTAGHLRSVRAIT
jgi:hypothetical protein